MPKKVAKGGKGAKEAESLDPRFVAVVAAFRADPALAPIAAAFDEQLGAKGRSFGSRGLKTRSKKLFAMMSTRGEFVVKLPKDRVAELVANKAGVFFDPGHGRLMKEWLAGTGKRPSWTALAKEAHAYVSGAK